MRPPAGPRAAVPAIRDALRRDWPQYDAAATARGRAVVRELAEALLAPDGPVARLRAAARRATRRRRHRATGERPGPRWRFSARWLRAIHDLRLVCGVRYRVLRGLVQGLVAAVLRAPDELVAALVPSRSRLAAWLQQQAPAATPVAEAPAVWVVTETLDAVAARGQPLTAAIDATGLGLTGPGAWRLVKPGGTDRAVFHRDFVKQHAIVDVVTQAPLVVAITPSVTADVDMASPLFEALAAACRARAVPIARLLGDGSYGTLGGYRAGLATGATQVTLAMPRTAVPASVAACAADGARAYRTALTLLTTRSTRILPGTPAWREAVGAGARSLVETSFSILKRLTGPRLLARSWRGQLGEIWHRSQLWARWCRTGVSGFPLELRAPSTQAAHRGELFPWQGTPQRPRVGTWPKAGHRTPPRPRP